MFINGIVLEDQPPAVDLYLLFSGCHPYPFGGRRHCLQPSVANLPCVDGGGSWAVPHHYSVTYNARINSPYLGANRGRRARPFGAPSSVSFFNNNNAVLNGRISHYTQVCYILEYFQCQFTWLACGGTTMWGGRAVWSLVRYICRFIRRYSKDG